MTLGNKIAWDGTAGICRFQLDMSDIRGRRSAVWTGLLDGILKQAYKLIGATGGSSGGDNGFAGLALIGQDGQVALESCKCAVFVERSREDIAHDYYGQLKTVESAAYTGLMPPYDADRLDRLARPFDQKIGKRLLWQSESIQRRRHGPPYQGSPRWEGGSLGCLRRGVILPSPSSCRRAFLH